MLRNLFIDFQHAGVDDAHVEAGLDRVVEERAVHRFAHGVVAAETEADVADAAADFCEREILFDPLCRANEINGVMGVFLHAGANGEHVRIEDDVLRRETDVFCEQVVSALANLDLAFERVGLAAL